MATAKPKDHTKTIETIKKTVADMKKNVNIVTKAHEKAAAEKEQEPSSEDHQAALDHFAQQYKLAMLNKDEKAASEHSKSYHEYAAKLTKHYHSKLKESHMNKKGYRVDEMVTETKSAPKGFHFTKDGKLRRGDADRDGSGGPMLRSDPLDKTRNKVPPVSEEKKDKYDEGEYDREGDMAKSDLRSIIANAQKLHDMIDDADNLPEWVQSKITLSEDYISTVANYMTAEMNEEAEQMDELNQMTLSRYAGKARSDINKGVASGDRTKQVVDKLRKRAAGVKTANRKMASGEYSEEVELDEAASPSARFNQKVKQAQAAHEAGDHKKAKYHLDAARNFMLGINSTDHSKIKDSYPQYKKLRDLHTEEVVAEEVVLDELSKDTLKSYVDKVSTGPSRGKTQSGVLKSIKAITGVSKAIRKQYEGSNVKEDVEQVNELKASTLQSYLSKRGDPATRKKTALDAMSHFFDRKPGTPKHQLHTTGMQRARAKIDKQRKKETEMNPPRPLPTVPARTGFGSGAIDDTKGT